MTISEFSDQFDVLFSNITSNQAPGCNEYEKSLFLTKAEKEIVKNYFTANSKGNTIGQGFDDSAKRQADFSVLMKTSDCDQVNTGQTSSILRYTAVVDTEYLIVKNNLISFTVDDEPYTEDIVEGEYTVEDNTITMGSDTVTVAGLPTGCTKLIISTESVAIYGQIDDRSSVYKFPEDTFIVVNETIKTSAGKRLQVIPLRYDEYTRLMSKPFKRPNKNQAWRLMNSGEVDTTDGHATKYVEIVTNLGDTIYTYNIRYVRVPAPIILANLDGLSIDGQTQASASCELDPILHDDVLQRAVELAKIAWTATGQDNVQTVVQAGQRSE